MTTSPILNLWGILFLTRDLVHERDDAMSHRGSRNPHKCFREPQAVCTCYEIVDIRWRGRVAIWCERAAACSFEKEWHRDAKNIGGMLHPVSFTGYMDFETAAYQSVAPKKAA